MAKLEFILQAVTDSTHAATIRQLLTTGQPNQALISVGFVREAGVATLEEALKGLGSNICFFVGIRNEVTTVQGIKRLLSLGGKVYAVDTGSRSTIFHPKIYLARNEHHGSMIIGSANLTFQGLHNNIEASASVSLNLSNKEDGTFVEETEELFANLITQHPKHVFEIKNEKQAEELFESGRLSDERVIPAPSVVTKLQKGEPDKLPRMKLKQVRHPNLFKPILKASTKPNKAKTPKTFSSSASHSASQ